MNYVDFRRCHVDGCSNTTKNCREKFYVIPKYDNPKKAKRWLEALKYKPNLPSKPYVCGDHFEAHCYSSTLKTRLMKYAVPTIQHKIKTEEEITSLEQCMETHFVWNNVLSNTKTPKVIQPGSEEMCVVASIYVPSDIEISNKVSYEKKPKDKKDIETTVRKYLTEYYPDYVEEENRKLQTENKSSTQNSNIFPQNSTLLSQESCKENYAYKNSQKIINQKKQLSICNSISGNEIKPNEALKSTCNLPTSSLPASMVEDHSIHVPESTSFQQNISCLPTSSCEVFSGQLQNSSYQQNYSPATSTCNVSSGQQQNSSFFQLKSSQETLTSRVPSYPKSNQQNSLTTQTSSVSNSNQQNPSLATSTSSITSYPKSYQHYSSAISASTDLSCLNSNPNSPATSTSSVPAYSNSYQHDSPPVTSAFTDLSCPNSPSTSSIPSSPKSYQQNSAIPISTDPSCPRSNQQNSSPVTTTYSHPSYPKSFQQNSSVIPISTGPSCSKSNLQDSSLVTSTSDPKSCQKNSFVSTSTSHVPSHPKKSRKKISPVTSTSSSPSCQGEKLSLEEDLAIPSLLLPSSLSSSGVAAYKVVKLSYQKNSPLPSHQVPRSSYHKDSSPSKLPQALLKNTFDLKTDDDCDKFAANIARALKNLKNSSCRRKVQLNIQKILYEAL